MGDEDAGRGSPAPVEIKVFNQTYRVISVDGGERAEKVARLVDGRMRDVAARMTTHDVAKIAVMAALNIADDLLTLEEARGPELEVSAPAGESAAEPAAHGDEAHASTPARISWYESVFDEGFGSPRNRGERMSSRISERLQSPKRSDAEPPAVITDPEARS